jgi:hypothetical protein
MRLLFFLARADGIAHQAARVHVIQKHRTESPAHEISASVFIIDHFRIGTVVAPSTSTISCSPGKAQSQRCGPFEKVAGRI